MRAYLLLATLFALAACDVLGGSDETAAPAAAQPPAQPDGDPAEPAPSPAEEPPPAPNRPPVAGNVSVTGNEDEALSGLFVGDDPDKDTLSYTIIAQPAFGEVASSGPAFTYTPDANFFGTDEFQYVVTDGGLIAQPGLVSIVILPVNDPPLLTEISGPASGTPGSMISLEVVWSDPDSASVQLAFEQLSGTPIVTATVTGDLLEFTVPIALDNESLRIRLSVVDEKGERTSSEFSFTVLLPQIGTYVLTEIWMPGVEEVQGQGLNNLGYVTGSLFVLTGDFGEVYPFAFVWDGIRAYDLNDFVQPGDPLYGDVELAVGRDINDSGHIVGELRLDPAGPLQERAFYWDGSRIRDLGPIASEEGTVVTVSGLNNADQIVGSVGATPNTPHAVIWQGQSMSDIGTLGGEWSEASGINELGQVAGSSAQLDGAPRAFFWDSVTMEGLGTLGGLWSLGQAVNNVGHVVGESGLPICSGHAFVWDGVVMEDLGVLGGIGCPEELEVINSVGYAINGAGYAVGWATPFEGATFQSDHAFVWEGDEMHDLNELVDPTDPLYGNVEMREAKAINELGQILANGRNLLENRSSSFVLTPISVQ